jgi:hypothetical protein
VEALRVPEPNFFVLGMKSYGRNSTFLLRVGYEQVDEVARAYAPHSSRQSADSPTEMRGHPPSAAFPARNAKRAR